MTCLHETEIQIHLKPQITVVAQSTNITVTRSVFSPVPDDSCFLVFPPWQCDSRLGWALTPPLQPYSSTPGIPLGATSSRSPFPAASSADRFYPEPSYGNNGMYDDYTPRPQTTKSNSNKKWIVSFHFPPQALERNLSACFLVWYYYRYFNHRRHRSPCRCCGIQQKQEPYGGWIFFRVFFRFTELTELTQHTAKPQRSKQLHQEPCFPPIFLWDGLYTC